MSHSTHRSGRVRRVGRSVTLAAGMTLAMVAVAHAHDSWIIPDVFSVSSDSTIHLSGRAGTRFPSGSAIPAQRVAEARMIGAAGSMKIAAISTENGVLRLHQKAPAAGQYLFAVTLTPTTTRSTGAGLLRFLRAEGGAFEAARLEAANQVPANDSVTFTATSYATTMVEVGSHGPRAYSMSYGIPAEFIPLNDPSQLRAGDTLHVRVVAGGTNRPNIGVYAGAAADTSFALAADANGILHLPLTKAGLWNLRTAFVSRQPGGRNEWAVARTTYVFGVRASP